VDFGRATSITISDVQAAFTPEAAVERTGVADGRSWSGSKCVFGGGSSEEHASIEACADASNALGVASSAGCVHEFSYASAGSSGVLVFPTLDTLPDITGSYSGQEAYGSGPISAYSASYLDMKWSVTISKPTDLEISFHAKFWFGIAYTHGIGGLKDSGESASIVFDPTYIVFCYSVDGTTHVVNAVLDQGEVTLEGVSLSSSGDEFMTTFEGDVIFEAQSLSAGDHEIEILALTGDPRMFDYNGDGAFDCNDVMQFETAATGGSVIEQFDFNGDFESDSADAEILRKILEVGFGGGQPCSSSIPGDINNDGCVDTADLGILIGSFGSCPGCPADLNGDDAVDSADLGILIGALGTGC
jgi:hypothetical protein